MQLLLGISNNNEAAAQSHVIAACATAYNTQYQMMWKEVTQKATLRNEPLFDKTYYDGGSIWNEQYETGVNNRVPYVNQRYSNVLKYDGSRIDDVYEAYAREQKIECKFLSFRRKFLCISDLNSVLSLNHIQLFRCRCSC